MIPQQGQNQKQGAQDIFAFSYPGNRFHMERMQGKAGCGEGAGPECPGHGEEEEKQQGRGHGVKRHIDQMKSRGSDAEQLAVHHERQPGYRMPVARVKCGKRPPDGVSGESGEDVTVVRDVIGVIKQKKRKLCSPSIERCRKNGKRHTEEENAGDPVR